MMLADRVSVVTGAASGIGLAIAERFAREGAVVIAADTDADGIAAVSRELTAEGLRCESVVADAASPKDVDTLVAGVLERHGRLDVGVANAAIPSGGSVEDTPPDRWDRVLAVNLRGPYLLARAAIPPFRTRGGGVLINIASVNGFWAEPGCAAYTAAKGGLIALTRSIALDFGHLGVRCNCICPGYIDTPGAQRYFDTFSDPDAQRAADAARPALGRLGRPEEVASLAVFLAAEESSFCTAQPFIVDGGLTAGVAARPPA